MGCIWRINLDAMWSRSESTAEANMYRVLLGLQLSNQVGLSGPYEHFGPLPYKDHCGYEVATQMVLHSKNPGRHSKNHIPYDTIHQLRAAHSNQVRTIKSKYFGNRRCAWQLSETQAGSMWVFLVL